MEGTLAQEPVTELFRDLHARRSTGVLSLSNGETTKRVYFEKGSFVFASSSSGEERLGERLVRAGRLKRSELELACRVVEESRLRLGVTLVDLGYLSRTELDEKVREQVEHIIRSVMPWGTGSYRKELKPDPVEPDLAREDLSTVNLLLDGIRAIEDPGTIRRGIGDLEAPLQYAADPASFDQSLRLTPEEGFVLSRVEAEASAGEIARLSPLGEERTLRCIYALVVVGLLSVRSAAPAEPRPNPTPAAPSEPPPAAPRALSPEAIAFREEMLSKYRRADEITLYELLDVRAGAPSEDVKSAFLKLAKKLHPDHRAGLKLDDAGGAFDELYLRIKAAYEVLSKPTERRRYDFTLERKSQLPKGESRPTSAPKEAQAEKKNGETSGRTFSSEQMARVHYGNGERYFNEARYHEAVEELRAAVRFDGSKAQYHRLLARALAKNPKWRKQAEEHYRKALAVNRFDGQSYLELGELYEASGLTTRARKMFEEAVALDPDNARAEEKLAGVREESSAIGRLREILQRDRES